ncbi:MAG: phenylalanine--tRNA ligase beta subunit [Isosphaeraceae bacterium]|jgi:phenylalanyl-tRNA synthetase beta chain|nr:MAG: phenylalanine--tRNA ligase beta subunit [Isosphaeraceae bacterium]
MIVSWNWLAEYVRLDRSVEELTERLALSGLNHEGTTEVGGDLAIDLEVTSNRADCLSHLGIAREVAVLQGDELREPDPRPAEVGEPVERLTAVAVEAPDVCPLFTARVVTGVRVGESPWWMRRRLETLGVRPVSNVVDITNYVLFECGQPLHAYDLDRLAGRRLIVRKARAGETLRAINGKVYPLSPEMLVIADAERPVGLAGVMGGLETEIGPETRNVLIESAVFDPVSVRRTARALGLHSPSSFRFERGIDPERTEWASRRCAELILELAGGTLHRGVIQVGSAERERPAIVLRFGQIGRILGVEIEADEAVRILRALGLECLERGPESARFRPPSWRPDLEREIDLIEEVARIHGYDQIPEDRRVPLSRSARGRRERVEAEVRATLAGLGLNEAYTYSLVAEPLDTPITIEGAQPSLRVDHSSRKKETALRQSLVPSLLAARASNEAHGNPDVGLFEIATVYLPRGETELPDQPTRLGMVMGGDFAEIKGVVEALVERLHVNDPVAARPLVSPLFREGHAAALSWGGEVLGYVGVVSEAWRKRLDLNADCVAAELELDRLVERAELVPAYRRLPTQPAVTRDLSLVVDRRLPWAELAAVVEAAAGPELEAVTYLDTFTGGNLPPSSQSVHFGLRFRHPERTLTGAEVDQRVAAVVEACRTRLGAELRS